MLRSHWGYVREILAARAGAVELRVEIPEAPEESGRALAYPALTGPPAVGDRVLLNTTAVHLRLGTGGLHFVMAVDRPAPPPEEAEGHLVKLRYTPVQHAVATVEESQGPLLDASPGLQGTPVVAAELHSQVAAIAAGVQTAAPGARVVYVMPDAAALPLALSKLVPALREAGLLAETITCGQAFGGGREAISLPSALAAAREACGADVIVVAQGPGNAGTGTRLGFSGIAQADWLNAAHALGGRPVAAVRLSFVDPRPRHQGISHHTLTVLGTFCLCRALVPLPALPPGEAEVIGRQLAPLCERHDFGVYESGPALALLEERGLQVSTMGRAMAEERAFFLAAGAAGVAAGGLVGEETGERCAESPGM